MTTLREILDQNENTINGLTDAEISEMSYAIKYFDFGAAMINPTDHRMEIMDLLEKRLAKIEIGTKKMAVNNTTKKLCNCGHYDENPMTTSSGSSCADCYDRMSD